MPDPFFSEIKYLGGANEDFIEVAVDAGTDVSDLVVTVYNANGSVRSSSNISVLTPTTVNGFDVYLIENGDATNFNGVALNNAVALSENGTVYQFLSFTDTPDPVTATAGPANGLTSTEIGEAPRGSSLETQDQGGSYFEQSDPDPDNVVCFANGTRIETDAGPVLVEDLHEGAMVRMLDGAFRPLRKILSRRFAQSTLATNAALWPVRISAGALGQNVPSRDIRVSRQHRMLVSSPITQRMFGRGDVLVAAIRLTDLPGVFVEEPDAPIEYFHLLFDDHEVIFADGAPSESFFLGPVALSRLPEESVEEIKCIFPDLTLPMQVEDSKHLIPNKKRQMRLVARHVRRNENLVSLR